MSRHFVAYAGAMKPGDRTFAEIEGRSVGVFALEKSYVAYENMCPHMGGPVCEGRIMPRVKGIVDDAGSLVAERSNDDKPQLICPWHGWEYDLRTGRCVGDRAKSLRTYHVEVQDGKIYVVA